MTNEATTELDIFDELNGIIEKALEKSNLRKKAASLKKQAFDRTVGARIREKALLEYRETLALIEIEMWQPVAVVALFNEQQCDGCGSIHRVFLQYMEIQSHKTRPSNRRWLRISLPSPGLPRETYIQPNRTHICPHCCDEHGFDITQAGHLALTDVGPLAISDNYLQGDINAPSEVG
jgi:hypothetical protein